ncbi:hypothetical protein MG296_07060 [Flavobacteriaceae bacterium TK19130]|nr:hypothetical protein [Thermobacterium salinum]
MNYLLSALFTLVTSMGFAQPNTEVYLLDISITDEFTVSKVKNISQNDGYDNQPSFKNNEELLFAKTRNGQTDIASYNLQQKITEWLSHTPQGGEYSPIQIPDSEDISAVRLDTTGLQRLYRYDIEDNNSQMIVDKLQVAYYSFLNEEKALASVLDGDELALTVIHFSKKQVDTVVRNVGRSLHRIGATEMMSYTFLNDEGNYDVYQWDMVKGESFFVAQLPIGIQDHIWVDEARLLIGSGSQLFMLDLFGEGDWEKVADVASSNISEITRMAISPDKKHLAIVGLPTDISDK